ncbi:MAG: cytochrome b/b6 domain-containing protein [Minicystis sp.]
MMSRTIETTAKRVLVWDLPTRLLHWLLAASFIGAFAVAVLSEHRNPVFAVHMLLGAIAAFVVVLRIAWGFVGLRYARFRSFAFGPRAVVEYVRGAFAGRRPGQAASFTDTTQRAAA